MNCVDHPAKKAVGECCDCKKPLCDVCAMPAGAGGFTCIDCAAQKAAEKVAEIKHHRQTGMVIKEVRRKQFQFYSRLAVLCLSLVVMAGNIYLYWKGSAIDTQLYPASEEPLTDTILVDSALRIYAEEHGGQYPESLDEGLTGYLPTHITDSGDLNAFTYTRSSPYNYQLASQELGDTPFDDLVFNEGGPSHEQK